jgi:type I restriction-modification system DNA methylase subunit
MSSSFKPLLNQNLLRTRVASFVPQMTAQQDRVVAEWVRTVADPHFRYENEKPHQGPFLTDIFGILLGYEGYSSNPHAYNLRIETSSSQTRGGKTPDASLGFYGSGQDRTRAVIELKAPGANLDGKQAGYGGITPVEQAFGYAPKFEGCRWVIVSNFVSIRLYDCRRGEGYFHQWNLTDLTNEDTLREFLYVLSKRHLTSEKPLSLIEQLAQETHANEERITKDFYEFYKQLRSRLFEQLVSDNPPPLGVSRPDHEIRLLGMAQKTLDRVLFICFCEDLGLLPFGLIRKASEAANSSFVPTSRWQQMLGLFDVIDKGNPRIGITGYDGGLFEHDADLAGLIVSEQFVDDCLKLSAYDFARDLDVNILGHIFEQSISDMEALRGEIQGKEADATRSRRKKEGIFYTPEFVTRFIVENTVGSCLTEKFVRIHEKHGVESVRGRKKRIDAEIRMWEDYREALRDIKVLEPACGSGAFLMATFDYLYAEYTRVNRQLADLREGQESIFDLDRQILQENLFGVDLNSESVEITKLSLWLKTARRDKPLNNLDANIKCGNSIIAPLKTGATEEAHTAFSLVPEEIKKRAFDWETEFPEVFVRGGFDCVIGNPPYVRQEWLSAYKPYLRHTYTGFSSTADLIIYFLEHGFRCLKPGGRLGYITSGTFARANFAAPFRKWLSRTARFEKVVNFGENQPFEDAEMVYPTISILIKDTNPRTFRTLFVRGPIPESLGSAMETEGVDCDERVYEKSEWLFQPFGVTELCDRIRMAGRRLKDLAAGNIYYGIKTGLNSAFIIDRRTRDRLVATDRRCEPILRKLFAGQDLRPWYQEDKGRWLILIPSGLTAARCGSDQERVAWEWLRTEYPPVAEHLSLFEERGRHRQDRGQFWWELRSCDYYDAFSKPKIVWPDIAKLPRFSWESTGAVLNNTGYVLTTDSPWILSILQSRLIWFCISQTSTPLRLRGGLWQYRCIRQFMERLPIVEPEDEIKEELARLGLRATALAAERYDLHQSFRHRIQVDLGEDKRTLSLRLEAWWTLSFTDFRKEVGSALGVSIPLRERTEWEEELCSVRSRHDELTERLVGIEKRINDLVYGLYGLSNADIHTLEEHCSKAMIDFPWGAP